MRKKLLAILLALTAAGSLAFGLTACGNSGNNTDNGSNTEQPDVVYSEGLALELSDDETSYVVSGIGDCKDTDIYIPKAYNGKPVTSIGYSAFEYCTSLTTITIPNSVTSIGDEAFEVCSSLTSITIPNSVTSIGYYAFSNCSSLESVTFGENSQLTSIGDSAFDGCNSLTSITIPNSVTSIRDYAFSNCRSLESITIPDSVTSIGEAAFYGCSALTSVTMPDNVKNIGRYAFQNCSSLTSITIPNSVRSIEDYAFSNCTSLVYNEYDNALYLGNATNPYVALIKAKDTSVTTCNINENTKVIADSAFSYCSSLKYNEYDNALYLGNSTNPYVALIKAKDNSIATCNINENTKVIVDSAFRYCRSLESITIPDSVTSIGSGAFENCTSLTSITIPDNVKNIGRYAFAFCSSLESITVGSANTVYHSADNCLIETESKTLVLGCKNSVIPTDGSVTGIGVGAFDGCSSLESITIPNSVTSIGYLAFGYCYSLKSITIPDSVTSIGSYAFEGCSMSISITYNGTKSQWDAISKSYGLSSESIFVIHCTDGDI